jgi:hypothetical protein
MADTHPDAPASPGDERLRAIEARALLPELVDLARGGLVAAGVEAGEADGWLAVVRERLAREQTGARWQRRAFEALRAKGDLVRATAELLARYAALSDTGAPVHAWPSEP